MMGGVLGYLFTFHLHMSFYLCSCIGLFKTFSSISDLQRCIFNRSYSNRLFSTVAKLWDMVLNCDFFFYENTLAWPLNIENQNWVGFIKYKMDLCLMLFIVFSFNLFHDNIIENHKSVFFIIIWLDICVSFSLPDVLALYRWLMSARFCSGSWRLRIRRF